MLGKIFLLFLAYVIYKLVFDFILPLHRASKAMNEKIKGFNKTMQEPVSNDFTNTNTQSQQQSTPKKEIRKSDYIDFEEVK
jgi:hypothetical protein